MAPRPKPFKTEVELCARFLAALPEGWTPYAESAGWDILLVRAADGFQIGIEAKLKLNTDVINQALEDGYSYSVDSAGPDCRAVLVPEGHAVGFGRIAAYIGLTIIRVHDTDLVEGRFMRKWARVFSPDLPTLNSNWNGQEWFECCPTKRHKLPEYVPDVAAGASAPIQLTQWKISAIKIAVTLEKRGFVTRQDFKTHGIDYRRWISAEGWLRAEDGRFVAGRMPDFKAQHPIVYEQIAADSGKWMPEVAVLPLQHGIAV